MVKSNKNLKKYFKFSRNFLLLKIKKKEINQNNEELNSSIKIFMLLPRFGKVLI